MKVMNNSPTRSRALVAAILVGLLGAGCVGVVQSEQQPANPTPKALISAATVVDDTPDVRVISMDFDPPLNSDGSCTTLAQRTLLVAVDNRGKKAENDVVVKLEIKGPEDKEALISQLRTVSSVASGEVKVLKFTGFASLPARPVYNLVVDVQPVVGELSVDDNHKSLEVGSVR